MKRTILFIQLMLGFLMFSFISQIFMLISFREKLSSMVWYGIELPFGNDNITDGSFWSILAIFFVIHLLALITFFKLIVALQEVKKDRLFSTKIISNLRIAAWLQVIAFSITLIYGFIKNLTSSRVWLEFIPGEWWFLLFGLLLFVISLILIRARELQEENQLTI